MNKLIFIIFATLLSLPLSARTLVVYYSFTNNTHTIVTDLLTQIDADVVRVEPADEGIDYAANNYAVGSAQIAAIRNSPTDAASYPAVKPVNVDLSDYDTIILAAPLWWSQMAAPLQAYLFAHGGEMAGKNIGLIVSSASSGISGVAADARRLIPGGRFLTPNLWIRSSQTASCHSMIARWLGEIDYDEIATAIPSVPTDADASAPATNSSTTATNAVVTVDGRTIRLSGSYDVLQLFDASGRIVLKTASGRATTAALAPGAYVAKITRAHHTTTRKLLITK